MALTARGRATREAFREGARRVFARDGYLNARLVDIAVEAGRSTGMLYQHFDGKESLLADLAEHFSEELQARMNEPIRQGLEPIAALRESIRQFWEYYKDHLPEVVGISQAAMVDRDFATRWRGIQKVASGFAADGIRRAQSAGYCPGLNPDVAGSALIAMIEQFCLTWQYQREGADIELSDEVAVDTLWQLWAHALYWTEPHPLKDGGSVCGDKQGTERSAQYQPKSREKSSPRTKGHPQASDAP